MAKRFRASNRLSEPSQRSFAVPASPKPPALAEAQKPVGRYASEHEVFFADQPLEVHLKAVGFEDTLDLRKIVHALDFTPFAPPASTGRPPLHPRVFIGLVQLGLLQGISSLRKLEALARADLRAMYLCRGHQPDHSSIGNFLLENAEYLSKQFFVDVTTKLARKSGLRGGVTALDGSIVQAVASAYDTVKAEAAREAAEALRAKLAAEPNNPALAAKTELAVEVANVAELRALARAEHGRDPEKLSIAPTEPDAVVQPLKQGGIAPSYKPSVATHESGLVIGQGLDASSETNVVGDLLDQATQVIGEKPSAVPMDAGYSNEPTFAAALARDINLLVPSGKESSPEMKKVSRTDLFTKSDFTFDAGANAMRCPAGQLLPVLERVKDGQGRDVTRYQSNRDVCGACPLKQRCIKAKSGTRLVLRYAIDELKDDMAKILKHPQAKLEYGRRKVLVEGTFANLKVKQRFRRFTRFGLKGARLELALHCTAYNIGWALRRAKAVRAAKAAAGSPLPHGPSSRPRPCHHRWSRRRNSGRRTAVPSAA